MYTRCPACQTVFHLRAAQLSAAHGQVRCGDCGEIFQSLSSLYDDPVAAIADTTDTVSRPQAEPETEKPEEVAALPETAEAPARKTLADVLTEPDSDIEADSEIEAGASRAELDVLMPDEPPPEQHDDLVVEEDWVGRQTPVNDNATTEQEAAASETVDSDVSVEQSPPRFDIPPDFILDSQQARHWSAARAASWAAAVVLILTLIGQGFYASRGKLAGDPALLPWVVRFCGLLNCDVPFSRDVGGIQVVERQVREHPENPGALIVYSTFVNTSSFVQPYPVLELRLADLSGGLVAGRRFLPSEYLQENVNVKVGMQPSKPVSIELELVQPDINVVSYQFDFL